MKKGKYHSTDFLVVGGGVAGGRSAIELAQRGRDVTLVTKEGLDDTNTALAQGGIAVVEPDLVAQGRDSYESHVQNTHDAGKGLCLDHIVKQVVMRGFPDGVKFLDDIGVEFSKKDGDFVRHKEGGHDYHRIRCQKDITGKAIQDAITDKIRSYPNIRVLENHSAINLITHNRFSPVKIPQDRCYGAHVLDREKEIVDTIQAKKVILATGGSGRVFQYTSNPAVATGDGIAMAYRAGARIGNMEFFQFHPTVLYEPNAEDSAERRFLLTEALRGMGAILTLGKELTEDFVLAYHTDGSHSTRDVVAKAIDNEMKKNGLKHVWLNITPEVTGKSAEHIIENYTNIYEKCLSKGMDITKEAVPVVPAAHYQCGGILVDEFGLTDIGNLYAVGEVSCTGLMGANRLASNSLLEGVLYGLWAVNHAEGMLPYTEAVKIPEWDFGKVYMDVDPATRNQFWDITRSVITNLCGIVRNKEMLSLAVSQMNALANAADDIYRNYYPTQEIIELRNITIVGKLIAESAYAREESRGCHFRSDFPENRDAYLKPTIVRK